MTNFKQALKERILVLDGSMGALLQKRGLPAGMAPDVWMLENNNREVIKQIHSEYIQAGADIVLTNTFGASKWRLEEYDAYNNIKKINAVAIEVARDAARDLNKNIFIAGDIGPSGETVYPTGQKSFEEVCDIFYEQAKILIELGVDVIAIETMFDSLEYRCALSAVRAASLDVPIMAFATFNTDGITDTGASPENIVAIAEGFHADVVGLNCSTGPESMVPVVKNMSDLSNIFVGVQPNAGLPLMRDGETVFPLTPEEMAPYVKSFVESGARVVGGCCGTKPEYTQIVRKIVDDYASKKGGESQTRTLISSLSGLVKMGGHEPFVGIGEKMNPTGRKLISDTLKKNDLSKLMLDAETQIKAGGKILDLNVGVPLVDEVALMKEAVVQVQNKYPQTPLMLDSSNSFALDAGASVYYGRPLLNSINAEDEKIEEMLPIVKKHGGAVVCLLTGIEVPELAEERLNNGLKVFEILKNSCGLREEDLVFDCLGLVISAMQKGSIETLKTIDLIKDRFPNSATTLGLSNTSFGLPNRRFVHTAFLVMAVQRGLDSAIMSVTDKMSGILASAANMWSPKNNSIGSFIDNFSEKLVLGNSAKTSVDKKDSALNHNGKSDNLEPDFLRELCELDQKIFRNIVAGDKDDVKRNINLFLENRSGESMELFMNVMTPAIRHLGDLFAKRIKFIPHLIAAADAMKAGVEILEPHLIAARAESNEEKGCVIFATVKGDIHDIGKNICVLMLRNFGYEVIDLGRNVDAEVIIAAGLKHNAQVLALSALMTTTMIQMKVVIDAVKARNLPFKVVIGGAVVTPEFAREIHADGFSTDVGTVVSEMEKVIALLEALS